MLDRQRQHKPDAPLLTVITIFFNAETFIEEAIESIIEQTFRKWELILVDDGSTDLSTLIAKRYAQQTPGKIRYLDHPDHKNLGMSASRNLGVSMARGEFIAFLDADDIWLPTRLERHVEVLLVNQDVAMVYGPTLYWYSWAPSSFGRSVRLADEVDYPGPLELPINVPISPPAALVKFLESGGSNLPGMGSLTARKKAIESVSGFEPAFRGSYEDQVFLSKMCLSHTVLVLDEVLDYYRQHDNSYCSRAIDAGEYHPTEPHPSRSRYLSWLEQYCALQHVTDPRIWKAIRKQQLPYRHPLLYRLTLIRPLSPKKVLEATLPQSAYQWLRTLRRRLGHN